MDADLSCKPYSLFHGIISFDQFHVSLKPHGNKNPNSSGKDIFTFLLCIEKSKLKTFHPISNKAFGTFYEFEKREEALNECAAKNSHCTNLLQFDNWEFKDDYPYKL